MTCIVYLYLHIIIIEPIEADGRPPWVSVCWRFFSSVNQGFLFPLHCGLTVDSIRLRDCANAKIWCNLLCFFLALKCLKWWKCLAHSKWIRNGPEKPDNEFLMFISCLGKGTSFIMDSICWHLPASSGRQLQHQFVFVLIMVNSNHNSFATGQTDTTARLSIATRH